MELASRDDEQLEQRLGSQSFLTLAEALDHAVELWGEQVGWIFDDEPVTFADMQRQADEVARALLAVGIGKGDIIAVWMPNLLEFASCQFACARIGAVLTSINTRSKLMEVQHTLEHSGAKLLVMVDTFLRHDFRATLLELCPTLDDSSGIADLAAFPQLMRVVSLSPKASHAMSWDDFLELGLGIDASELERAKEGHTSQDALLLQYTSGTTARPKGALLSNRYVTYLGADFMREMGVGVGEAVLNTQPFYHVGGSCVAVSAPVVIGCRMVVPSYYEVDAVLSAIKRHCCVARSGYGAMYIMEMAHPAFYKAAMGSLRTGWCVGPPELFEEVRDTMGIPGLLQIYGSTEANGTSGRIVDPWHKRSETCGRVLPHTEIMIADPTDGIVCNAGQPGEILLRGPYCMIGYLHQPEETAQVIDKQGWYHTGDLGLLDAEGFLTFRGRLKNMLKVGGENVSAEEVEGVLLQHHAIRQAAVFGIPDRRLQEVVCAAIELKQPDSMIEQDVIAYCAVRMANFRVPRRVVFMTEWPLTGSGKIQKHVVRAAVLESQCVQ